MYTYEQFRTWYNHDPSADDDGALVPVYSDGAVTGYSLMSEKGDPDGFYLRPAEDGGLLLVHRDIAVRMTSLDDVLEIWQRLWYIMGVIHWPDTHRESAWRAEQIALLESDLRLRTEWGCSAGGRSPGGDAMEITMTVELAPCPHRGAGEVNTLDLAGPREDGHRFLLSTRYGDGGYDAECISCGLRVHFTRDGVVDEAW